MIHIAQRQPDTVPNHCLSMREKLLGVNTTSTYTIVPNFHCNNRQPVVIHYIENKCIIGPNTNNNQLIHTFSTSVLAVGAMLHNNMETIIQMTKLEVCHRSEMQSSG